MNTNLNEKPVNPETVTLSWKQWEEAKRRLDEFDTIMKSKAIYVEIDLRAYTMPYNHQFKCLSEDETLQAITHLHNRVEDLLRRQHAKGIETEEKIAVLESSVAAEVENGAIIRELKSRHKYIFKFIKWLVG